MSTIAPSFRNPTFAAFALLALSLFASPFPANAETTEWAGNEGGRMRIVALAPDTRGIVRGALQIEPKAGWITYWREPGDAGIPPHIDFPSSPDVTLERMSYPIPKRFDNGELRDIGYDGPVALPFELRVRDPSTPARVAASAFIGLCRNICIPFQAEFSLSLKQEGGTSFSEAMIINEAEAKLPEAPSDDFAVTQYAVSADGDELRLRLRLPTDMASKPKVIVTGPEGHVLFNDDEGKREGADYSVALPVGKLPKGYELKGKRWGILVLAGQRAMETSLAFE